jgi:addiction module RelB/DinJ family antitoxin
MATKSPSFLLRTRVPAERYSDASAILDSLGLTPQDAVNAFFAQVVIRRGLPFQVSEPVLEPLLTLEEQGRVWDGAFGEFDWAPEKEDE